MTGEGRLAGLRVVECSSTPAAIRAGGFLSDYGADVVWVEPPGGSPVRGRYPVERAVFTRGKRSIVLDIRTPHGREQLLEVMSAADVFIEDWAPGQSPAGIAFDELHDRVPHLVWSSITGFGQQGHLANVPNEEALVHALVGTMADQLGALRDGPIFEGLPFASIGAAMLAVIGILAALWRRREDGVGRYCDTSLFDGALAYLAVLWGDTDADTVRDDAGIVVDDFLIGGSARLICGSFRCADDRYISVHTGAVGAFGRLMRVLGLHDRIMSSDSGLDMAVPLTAEERTVLHGEIHEIFARHTVAEWEERLLNADVFGIPALPPGEVFDAPQARFNGMVLTVDDPELGRLEQVAPPIKFAFPPMIASPAPRLGDTQAGDVATAWASQHRPWCGAAGVAVRTPLLADVRILDAGAFFAGPYASRLLAELGADVIKLETTAGDPMRGLPGLFRGAQAGKRSVAVDLKDPDVRPALGALIEWADIVHHNMRPGAAERIGLGHDDVRSANPAAIYGYAPGWGSAGPSCRRQSFEPMMSGYVGANFEVAGQFNPPLYPQGNADPGNGLVGAAAMLLALLHRERTGEPLHFENPQLNATMTHVAHIVRRADGEMLNAGRLDPLQYGIGPVERLYETADGWIVIVATTDEQYAALAAVLGLDLDDERFRSNEARLENEYALVTQISARMCARTTSDLLAALVAAKVPAAEPVPSNNHTLMRDPEARTLGRVAEVASSAVGNVREVALLLRVSDARRVDHRLAPSLGEHTASVLRDLGYDDDSIAKLRSRGAIAGEWP